MALKRIRETLNTFSGSAPVTDKADHTKNVNVVNKLKPTQQLNQDILPKYLSWKAKFTTC